MDRGQIHTLEAFLAALLIVGALLFASQATAVTPLSASTSNQHIENQQLTMGEDVLTITAEQGQLQAALTYWNVSEGHPDVPPHFANVSEPERGTYSAVVGTDHPLSEPLESAFGEGRYAYNLDIRYLTPAGNFETVEMIVMGTPSDNAVTATRTVTLFEHDTLSWEPSGDTRLSELDGETFWAPPVNESGSVYNIVEVRMTIWRM